MGIIQRQLVPSREDAVRMTRNEKTGMIVLSYIATVFDDMQAELADRLGMVENGPERMRELAEKAESLLNDMRLTIPMKQRIGLQNVGKDFDMRIAPKASPFSTSTVMQNEEFKELVDFARAKCVDCMEDDEECKNCGLYQLLTSLVPLDDYHSRLLCPYNMGEWVN